MLRTLIIWLILLLAGNAYSPGKVFSNDQQEQFRCTYLDHLLEMAQWRYEVDVTISASLIDGSTDFTDMPVYIALSDLPAHFWENIQSDGDDIRIFTTAYPGVVELPRHLISITDGGASGTGTLFTKRTIDDAATTLIV